MTYYIIAGEASGDLHGAHLIQALRRHDPEARFRVWGGDLMRAAGGELVKHYRDLAFMGFVEVVRNLPTILRNLRFCKEDILAYQPDALILIDYPGFNLRIAKWARDQSFRVFYYISPQIWAWHSSRVHQIRDTVDRMFVILPFEQDFYKKYEVEVDYVGHPLLDVVAAHQPPADFHRRHGLDERPIVALLPGSRRQEIERVLPLMLAVTPHFPQYQFVIAGAPAQERSFYEAVIAQGGGAPTVHLVEGRTYDLLSLAEAALVTSGTATLETALFGVPQVVCYRGGRLSYWIARRLVNVAYISLVNLIVDRPLLRELVQDDLTVANLTEALRHLLGEEGRAAAQAGYADLQSRLGKAGAAERAAALMVGYLRAG